jgi:hypothetical protein
MRTNHSNWHSYVKTFLSDNESVLHMSEPLSESTKEAIYQIDQAIYSLRVVRNKKISLMKKEISDTNKKLGMLKYVREIAKGV